MKPEILYVSTGLPELRKAHSIQTFFTCKELANFFNVVLVYPLTLPLISRRKMLVRQYKKVNVKLILLPTTSLGRFFKSDILFMLDKFIFSLFVLLYTILNQSKIILTRDTVVAFCLANFYKSKRKVILEIHKLEHMTKRGRLKYVIGKIEKSSLKKADFVISITKWMLNYVKKLNCNVTFIPDSFEPSIFKRMSKKKVRRMLNLSKGKNIVLYSGLTFRHGILDLIKAGKILDSAEIFIVGGDRKEVNRFEHFVKSHKINNTFFIPRVPIEKVSLYLNAADILVLPYSSNEFNEYFTSPLKLFEYMAVKKPIVATKVGCFKGILKDGYNCILVEPDNPQALAKGILKLLENKKLANRIAENAYKESNNYTYEKRAKRIKKIIEIYFSSHR